MFIWWRLSIIFTFLCVLNVVFLTDIKVCKHKIYCNRGILNTLRENNLFKEDSKSFLDLSINREPLVVLSRFEDLEKGALSRKSLEKLLSEYFDKKSNDLIHVEYATGELPFANDIADLKLKEYAGYIFEKWKFLVVRTNHSRSSDQYSSILMNYPFVKSCDSSDCREMKYADIHLIIVGLVESGLQTLARGILLNLLGLVDKYGFVPLANRVYYLSRSSLPMLSETFLYYITETKDSSLLNTENLKILETEYNFWMSHRVRKFPDGTKLNYFSANNIIHIGPRFELYNQDLDYHRSVFNESDSVTDQLFYQHIFSEEESGWVHSSRWMTHESGSDYSKAHYFIPVDLNSVLYGVEKSLSTLYYLLYQRKKLNSHNTFSSHYLGLSEQRKRAMFKYLWNPKFKIWSDYNYQLKKHKVELLGEKKKNGDKLEDVKAGLYLSNFFPVYYGILEGKHENKTVKGMSDLDIPHFFSYEGGIPLSNNMEKKNLVFSSSLSKIYKDTIGYDFPFSDPFNTYIAIRALQNIRELNDTTSYSSIKLEHYNDMKMSLIKKWVDHGYCYDYYNSEEKDPPQKKAIQFKFYDVRSMFGSGVETKIRKYTGYTPSNALTLYLLKHYGERNEERGGLDASVCVEDFTFGLIIFASSLGLVVCCLVSCIVVVTAVIIIAETKRRAMRRNRKSDPVSQQLLQNGNIHEGFSEPSSAADLEGLDSGPDSIIEIDSDESQKIVENIKNQDENIPNLGVVEM